MTGDDHGESDLSITIRSSTRWIFLSILLNLDIGIGYGRWIRVHLLLVWSDIHASPALSENMCRYSFINSPNSAFSCWSTVILVIGVSISSKLAIWLLLLVWFSATFSENDVFCFSPSIDHWIVFLLKSIMCALYWFNTAVPMIALSFKFSTSIKFINNCLSATWHWQNSGLDTLHIFLPIALLICTLLIGSIGISWSLFNSWSASYLLITLIVAPVSTSAYTGSSSIVHFKYGLTDAWLVLTLLITWLVSSSSLVPSFVTSSTLT